MDNLHTVLRSIRGERKARREHLTVFREFLNHLERITKTRSRSDRAARTGAGAKGTKGGKPAARGGRT